MKTAFLTLAVIITFTNCNTNRYAYSPSAHNVPILAKKADSKIGGYYSTNAPAGSRGNDFTDTIRNRHSRSRAEGFDLQAVIAITNHVAVEANYYHRNDVTYTSDTDFFDTSTIKAKRNLWEVGVGYFTSLDKKKHFLLQVFVGGGLGKLDLNEHGLDENLNAFSRSYMARLTKFYIEPAVIFRIREIFAASLATRISAVKFGAIVSNYTEAEKYSFRLQKLDQTVIVFFEPAIVCSFGLNSLPGLRPEFQLGVSTSNSSFIQTRFFNFSIGLNADIGKLIEGRGK